MFKAGAKSYSPGIDILNGAIPGAAAFQVILRISHKQEALTLKTRYHEGFQHSTAPVVVCTPVQITQ